MEPEQRRWPNQWLGRRHYGLKKKRKKKSNKQTPLSTKEAEANFS